MSRWIDADEIENAKFQEENLRGMGEHIAYRVGWNEAIESILENAPSIDICFCRECKYWLDGSGLCKHWSKLYGSVLTKADDFCSYGSRSEKPNNSTVSKMEQVETMSCAECKHRPIGAEICEEPCHYEPQTERSSE